MSSGHIDLQTLEQYKQSDQDVDLLDVALFDSMISHAVILWRDISASGRNPRGLWTVIHENAEALDDYNAYRGPCSIRFQTVDQLTSTPHYSSQFDFVATFDTSKWFVLMEMVIPPSGYMSRNKRYLFPLSEQLLFGSQGTRAYRHLFGNSPKSERQVSVSGTQQGLHACSRCKVTFYCSKA